MQHQQASTNTLFYGDNLYILREYIASESGRTLGNGRAL